MQSDRTASPYVDAKGVAMIWRIAVAVMGPVAAYTLWSALGLMVADEPSKTLLRVYHVAVRPPSFAPNGRHENERVRVMH